jgi:hypothetical protein
MLKRLEFLLASLKDANSFAGLPEIIALRPEEFHRIVS